MINPKVSVIIPSYNHASYVTKAIDSVLAQTYQPIEIIVINDGSTDNTQEVLKSYRNKIKYIYQDNRGLPNARNVGIKHATGEFIALLDADDLWLPDKLQKQMQLFKNDPLLKLTFHDIHQSFNGVIHVKTYWQRNNIKPCRGGRECLAKLFKVNFIPGGISVVFKKSLTDQIGWFDEGLKSAEDYDYWLRATSKNVPMGYLEEPLAIYRMHKGQMSDNINRMLKANVDVLKWVLIKNKSYFKDKQALVRYRLFYLFAVAAYRHLVARNVGFAIKNALKALIELTKPKIV